VADFALGVKETLFSVGFFLLPLEVTEAEFEQITMGTLPLPDGWRLGDTLYPGAT
jgi:hypothetical protein